MKAPKSTPLKKLAALMLIPFMLLVAGCGKLEATINVESPEKVTLEGVATMKKSALDQAHVTNDQFCGEEALQQISGNGNKPELKLEEKGDEVVCKFSAKSERKKPMSDALTYDEESDTYTYTEASKGSMGDQAVASGFEVDVTFVFPGKVTESSVGKIDGNKVHITDTKEYFSDINIKAEGSSFPWLIVIIVVVVLLLLIVAAIVIGAILLTKRKKSGASQSDFQQQGFNQNSMQDGFQQQSFDQHPSQGFDQHPSQGYPNDVQQQDFQAPQQGTYQAPQQGSYEAPQQGNYEAPQQGGYQPPQPGQQSQDFKGQSYGEPGNEGPQGDQGQTFGKQ